ARVRLGVRLRSRGGRRSGALLRRWIVLWTSGRRLGLRLGLRGGRRLRRGRARLLLRRRLLRRVALLVRLVCSVRRFAIAYVGHGLGGLERDDQPGNGGHPMSPVPTPGRREWVIGNVRCGRNRPRRAEAAWRKLSPSTIASAIGWTPLRSGRRSHSCTTRCATRGRP